MGESYEETVAESSRAFHPWNAGVGPRHSS
jgi:hypothetical protein